MVKELIKVHFSHIKWLKWTFSGYLKKGKSKSLANKSAILLPNHIAVAIIPELKIACSITAMATLSFIINQAQRLRLISAACGKTLVKTETKQQYLKPQNISRSNNYHGLNWNKKITVFLFDVNNSCVTPPKKAVTRTLRWCERGFKLFIKPSTINTLRFKSTSTPVQLSLYSFAIPTNNSIYVSTIYCPAKRSWGPKSN